MHNGRLFRKRSQPPNRELAKQYCVSHTTIGHWKNSDQVEDHSSQPKVIHYALTKAEERIITKVRDQGFLLDEILEALAPYLERLNRSNCYRTLLKYKRNRLTDKEKTKRKKFAQYEPGFLHIDVFYLPKIGEKGKKKRYYYFLAIDRATRLLLLEIYPYKGAREAGDFLMKCLQFFPFQIRFVLTDSYAGSVDGIRYAKVDAWLITKAQMENKKETLSAVLFSVSLRKPKENWRSMG